MTDIEVIRQWINGVKGDLIKNYDRLGLRASGNWAEELEEYIELKPNGYRAGIRAEKYTGVLTGGRSPNKDQSKDKIKAWVGWAGSTIISEWVELKGIYANPYAVAWKIARKGIEVPNEYNKGTLISDVLTDERIASLTKGLGLAFVDNVKSDVKRALNGN